MRPLALLLFVIAGSLPLPAVAQSYVLQGSLTLGEHQEGHLAPGEVHTWTLDLAAGDYHIVDVAQPDADLVLAVYRPNVSFYAYAFKPLGPGTTLQGRWIADTTGTWYVDVSSPDSLAATYTLAWHTRRPPTELDRELADLEHLSSRLKAYYDIDAFEQIDSLLTHTLAVAEEGLGTEHLEVAGILNQQAMFFMGQDQPDAAQAALDRALRIQKKQVGERHPETATTLSNMAALADRLSQYEKAEALYRRVLDINEHVLGPDHLLTLMAKSNLASSYHRQDRYAEADTLYRQAQAAMETLFGPAHPQVLSLLNNMAMLREDQGHYQAAEDLYQRILALREKSLGPTHSSVAFTLNNLGSVQQKRGAYKEALRTYTTALAIWESIYAAEPHSNLALVHKNLASTYTYLDDFAQAQAHYAQALAMEEQLFGPDHPRVATTLSNMAFLAARQGETTYADSLYQRALAIREARSEPVDLGILLSMMGQLYQQMGRFDAAEDMLNRSLRLLEQTLGPDHAELAAVLNNLASLHQEQGAYAEAAALSERALAILRQTHDAEHIAISQTLNNLATTYEAQGRYREVLAMYEQALQVAEATYGPSHSEVAILLNNISQTLLEQGRFREAEARLQRALRIDTQVYGPQHPIVGQRYLNQAEIYARQGRYAEAEQHYQRALDILTSTGPDSTLLGTALNNLGSLYIDQKRYAEAETLLKQALAIRETYYGATHPDVGGALNNLAVLYTRQEHYDRAEPYYRRALDILEATSGLTSLNYATGLNNLALLLTHRGDYNEAEALLTQALSIFEEHLGLDHPAITRTLIAQTEMYKEAGRTEPAFEAINRALDRFVTLPGYEPAFHVRALILRARLHHDAGDLDAALTDMEEALALVEKIRPDVGGGEQTRARFLETYTEAFDEITAWYLEAGDPEKALAYTERGRARVLLDQLALAEVDVWDGLPEERRATLEARDAEARARLAEFQQRLTLTYADPTLNERDRLYKTKALQDSLAAAEAAYAQVYQDLKSASPHWNDAFLSSNRSVDLRQVQRTLVPEDGLLLLYQMGAKTSHVFVVPPGRAEVEVFPLLIDENQAAALHLPVAPLTTDGLHTLLNGNASGKSQRPGLLQRFANPDTLQAATDPIAHALWQILVPDSLRSRLLAAETIVLIPDAGLHFLPFEALVVEPGTEDGEHTFWLDAGPVILYAPSLATLDRLARSHSNAWTQPTALLSLSNPTFDPQAVAEQSTMEENPALIAEASARTRYANRGGTLGALPGTARETRAIAMALGEEKNTLEVIQGIDATEATLREAIPGKRYLHLATHGLVDAQHNSLFASLVLTPPPGPTSNLANDGFLQLHEIYDLPLKDAELAVLSACQSSIGAAIEGEGVFALSRGFLTAGARRVIASQWDVNDASTAMLIGAFFEAVFEDERAGRPVDFARALRDAKRRVRQEKAWQSPFFWAPFVLIGAS